MSHINLVTNKSFAIIKKVLFHTIEKGSVQVMKKKILAFLSMGYGYSTAVFFENIQKLVKSV